jgi:hypothetical protein
MKLKRLPVRVRIQRVGPVSKRRTKKLNPVRAAGAFIGGVSLLPLVLSALPAYAATSGQNASTLTLAPQAVVSLTVTPTTGTFANCSGANSAQLAFPNGTCEVTGITITNGSVADQIFVNGQNAIPTDAGTPWTLVDATPGPNQFEEVSTGIPAAGEQALFLSNTPQCDTAFTAEPGNCNAAAGSSGPEIGILDVTGPSSSTDSGPFTVTTTWTAVASS